MNNACDLAISFTDQKLRKENTIFKTIHLLTAETDVSMVLYPAVCHTFEMRPRWKLTSDLLWYAHKDPSFFVLLALKSRLFIWSIYDSVFHCILICKSWEPPSLSFANN